MNKLLVEVRSTIQATRDEGRKPTGLLLGYKEERVLAKGSVYERAQKNDGGIYYIFNLPVTFVEADSFIGCICDLRVAPGTSPQQWQYTSANEEEIRAVIDVPVEVMKAKRIESDVCEPGWYWRVIK